MTFGLLSFGAPIPTYEGLVSTRAAMMQNRDTVNKQVMARKAVVSTEALTSIRLSFSGFAAGHPDVALGAASTITAAIEDASGNFTQLLFSGSPTGTIPNFGVLYSDYVTLTAPIPAATQYWVRMFVTSTAGVLYNTGRNTFYNEACAFAASGLTDQTMSGTITDSGLVRQYSPLAILGITKNPSAIVLGDSIGNGAGSDGTGNQDTAGTTAQGFDGRNGIICQSFGSNFPFLNLSIGSEDATNWLTTAAGRNLIIQKSSHLICQLGVNDLGNISKTAAQTITALGNIYALARSGQKIFQTTITPQCSASTDSWVTTAGQTPVAQAQKAILNDAIRGGTTGLSMKGFYDLASVVESSQDSDLWAVNGTPNFGTSDGLHPNNYSRFVSSGLIGPFVWP